MVEPKHSGPASYLRSQYVSEETGVGITITEPFAQKQPHNPSQTSKAHRHKKRPWKKLLWVKQDYADNYTDSSFLSQLKRNSTVVTYSYWRLFRDFSLIGMHLSVIDRLAYKSYRPLCPASPLLFRPALTNNKSR